MAEQFGGTVSRSQFVRSTGISEYQIYRLFAGGWSEVLQRAGLDRHPLDRDPLSDESLLQEFHRVASELQQIPTWQRFNALASISAGTVRKHFTACKARYGPTAIGSNSTSPIPP